MLLQEEEEEDEEDGKHGQNIEIIFSDIMYILHHNTIIFCILVIFLHILHLDIIKIEINFKLKVKMKNILIYGFQWG